MRAEYINNEGIRMAADVNSRQEVNLHNIFSEEERNALLEKIQEAREEYFKFIHTLEAISRKAVDIRHSHLNNGNIEAATEFVYNNVEKIIKPLSKTMDNIDDLHKEFDILAGVEYPDYIDY